MSSLIQLESSLIQLESSLFQLESSLTAYGVLQSSIILRDVGYSAVELKLMLCLCPARAAHNHCSVEKEQDSSLPKGSWLDTSGVIDCREDCGSGRIWYSCRHWSLEQGQAPDARLS